METLNIIIPIITLALGGGCTWIFTIKHTRRQAEADAMQHYQIAYQGLIKDLQDDRTELRKELADMRSKIADLEKLVDSNTRVIKSLTRLACVKAPQCADCVLIDISQL